jgi:hypothetical protein
MQAPSATEDLYRQFTEFEKIGPSYGLHLSLVKTSIIGYYGWHLQRSISLFFYHQ